MKVETSRRKQKSNLAKPCATPCADGVRAENEAFVRCLSPRLHLLLRLELEHLFIPREPELDLSLGKPDLAPRPATARVWLLHRTCMRGWRVRVRMRGDREGKVRVGVGGRMSRPRVKVGWKARVRAMRER